MRTPRPCYDNVTFVRDGLRIIGTVLFFDDYGLLVVSNPNWDDIWHVAVEDAAITDEDLNHPPLEW